MSAYKYQRARVVNSASEVFNGHFLWTVVGQPKVSFGNNIYTHKTSRTAAKRVFLPYTFPGTTPLSVRLDTIELLPEFATDEEVQVEPWADYCRREGLPVP